jgi:hypothetical protein
MSESASIRKRSVWKWTLLSLLFLLLVAFLLRAHFMGGPRDVYGFLRYALPQWHGGNLRVGDRAPDVGIFSLDGKQALYLHDWIGKRPLVLIFGSYT